VAVLLTSDEETGSYHSQELIRELAREADAVLVTEPAIDGALKTARKGTSWYDLQIRGLAAHAGLEPEKGINALIEAGYLVTEISAFGDPEAGTTVTPTTARAGVTNNTVPDEAVVGVDVRAWSAAEQQRVDALVRGWQPHDGRVSYAVIGGGINRAALEPAMSAGLFARASTVAGALGLPRLEERWVGGASDGNITAALGVPTLDGLGAVGAGAHADSEWASVSAMPQRAALLAGLVADLLGH
jgi:glutamate carboxypeptidase